MGEQRNFPTFEVMVTALVTEDRRLQCGKRRETMASKRKKQTRGYSVSIFVRAAQNVPLRLGLDKR